jgi:hypothetical protein
MAVIVYFQTVHLLRQFGTILKIHLHVECFLLVLLGYFFCCLAIQIAELFLEHFSFFIQLLCCLLEEIICLIGEVLFVTILVIELLVHCNQVVLEFPDFDFYLLETKEEELVALVHFFDEE